MLDFFPPPRSAYIHVPFCVRRCGYCTFTVIAGRDDLVDSYLTALERELSALESPCEVDTLYFGGGTPTQLEPPALARLFEIVRRWLPTAAGAEISVEANPDGFTNDKACVLRDAGVNRVSIGAQSFRKEKLSFLERAHSPAEIVAAVDLSRSIGAAVSLDLIFATPDETLAWWQADVAAALALAPDHLSGYGLTLEPGAAFWGRTLRGQLAPLDEDLDRAMYEHVIDALAAAGLAQYEVSNFARPGFRCRHNEVYWSIASWHAAGPGASRSLGLRRETNHRSVTTWLKRTLAGQSPVAEAETLTPEDAARERLVFGLRRLDGISRRRFSAATGFEIDALVGRPLRRYVEAGLLHDDGDLVRLTREGLMVSDALWPEFLSPSSPPHKAPQYLGTVESTSSDH